MAFFVVDVPNETEEPDEPDEPAEPDELDEPDEPDEPDAGGKLTFLDFFGLHCFIGGGGFSSSLVVLCSFLSS